MDNSVSKYNGDKELILSDPKLNRITYLKFLKSECIYDGVIDVHIYFAGYNDLREDVSASASASNSLSLILNF